MLAAQKLRSKVASAIESPRSYFQGFLMSFIKIKDYFAFCFLFGLLSGMVCEIHAQSLDARAPSPVYTNEVVGRIGARDIGDARLTDHFYSFSGTPGDLLITVETRNLNGDIDVFTAGALRPVFKLVLYAEVNTPVTKSVFLRTREDLILRVEARTPNDEEGTYHISFGGSFEPILVSSSRDANSELASAPLATRKGKRVSSVGARIEAPTPPPLEIAEATKAEPTPPTELIDPPPAEPRVADPKPAEGRASEPKVETEVEARPAPVRSPRSRSTTRRGRGRTATISEEAAKKPVVEEKAPSAEAAEETRKVEPVTEISEKPAAVKRSGKKRTRVTEEARENETPATAAESTSEAGPSEATAAAAATIPPEELIKTKLIIELLDGSRVERFMNTIRKVDVESGQIVITAVDGTVERIRLARVVRMSIGR
jgi:hypothetical protein